jgi:hypothetical protein
MQFPTNFCRGVVSPYCLLLAGLLLHSSGIVDVLKRTRIIINIFAIFWRLETQQQLICFPTDAFLTRKREIRKMRRKMANGHSFAFLCDDVDELEHSVQERLPRVSVIMPLKGLGEHNLQNWKTQVQPDCIVLPFMHIVLIFCYWPSLKKCRLLLFMVDRWNSCL